MHKIYELKEQLCDELEEYGGKGELDMSTLEIVDKLSHTIKNLDKIIESYEEEEYSSRGSYNYRDGGSYERGRGSYERGGRGRSSYARGRRRDGMGRYSRNMSYDSDMVMELRELMNEAPDEQTRQEMQRLISKMENM